MAAINANAFARCSPAISTNIKQCGTVTQCDAIPLKPEDLTATYMDSGSFRVMDALLKNDMEIKMCESVQNGLYEFFMSNKVNLSKKIIAASVNAGLTEIQPYIKARQRSPINNKRWLFSAGQNNAGKWQITVAVGGNVPFDVRSFIVGQRVYLFSKSAAGSATRTAYEVFTSAAVNATTGTLVLISLNAQSNLDADKLEAPVTGWLTRGANNVSDYESFCIEATAYTDWKQVPFWIGTSRSVLCKSQLYDKWRSLVLANNPLYRELFDLDEIEKNKQLGADWQNRMVESIFWGKALEHQTMNTIDELDDILVAEDAAGLSPEGGRCTGKRAEPVGIYEQLAECDRVVDLQGAKLNLPALFQAIYNLIRVRQGNGGVTTSIDLFMDSVTAEIFHLGMLAYFNSKTPGGNSLRVTIPVGGELKGLNMTEVKDANFGFAFRSYRLSWPNTTINVVTHYAFDDELAAAHDAGIDNTGRRLWILDMPGIYPGIVASNRVVNKTNPKTLQSINPELACVMEIPTVEHTLSSTTWTVIVECPKSSLILENFSNEVPEAINSEGNYDA